LPSFTDLLGRATPTLIFSLPRNDPSLAEAALEAGADALKVHIHVKHQASGTGFGPLAAEREALAAIRRLASGVPVGVVVGDDASTATREELSELSAMGFDLFDIYAHHMPAWMLMAADVEWMGALGPGYTEGDWAMLGRVFDCMEAAVMPHESYGAPMTAYDLARYGQIVELSEIPIVIPTQLAILPEEVELLAEVGVRGVMIGAIVTGKEPGSIASACREFRAACDAALVKGEPA
jgi:hypothetical protein